MSMTATMSGTRVENVEKSKRKTRRKLYISYPGLVFRMLDEQVESTDLEAGLFCLGCTRDYALDIDNETMRTLVRDPKTARDIHVRLTEALERSGNEDRVIWWHGHRQPSYSMLNELLQRNGYRPIESLNGAYYSASDYVAIKGQVEKANQFLEVVF